MVAAGWPDTVDLVNAAHDPAGGFVSLLGTEYLVQVTPMERFGHKNLILFGDESDYLTTTHADLFALGLFPDCQALWDKKADLRREFSNNFNAYVSYEKAVEEGKVRRLSRK